MRKFFLVLALALGFAVPGFAQVQLHTITVTDPYNVVIQTPTALSLYTRQQGYSIPVPANATSVYFYIKNNLGGVGTDTLTVTGMCSVNGQDFQGFLANNEPLQIAYNSRVATQVSVSGGNTVIRFNGSGVNADAVFSAAVSGCQNIQLNFSSPTGITTDVIAMGAAFSFGGLNGFNAGGIPLVNLCANAGGLNTSCNPLSADSNGHLQMVGGTGNNTSASGVNPVLVAGLDAVSGNVVRSIGVGSNGAIYLGQVLAGFSPASQGGIFPVNQAGTFAPLMVATGYQYGHITTTTATPLGTSNGRLFHTLNINTGGAGTVKVFDLANASCTGTPATNVVASITATATTLQTFTFDATMTNGLCVQASVAMDLTVTYQ